MPEVPTNPKILVLDDDPTGSQTVHSCPLLLRWDADTLAAGLRHPSPLLFLLANTRALDPEAAATRVRQICQQLKPALAQAQAAGVIGDWLLVSRGDSTLRGHCPLEAEILAQELGPFAATLLVPAFPEGGRTTVEAVHRLHGQPVHETAFGRDGLFGYDTSHLPSWLEGRSGGRLRAAAVRHLPLQLLEAATEAPAGDPLGPRRRLMRHLRELEGQGWAVVDAERPAQLLALGQALRQLQAEGGPRFLFQSAASLLSGLAELPPQPLGPAQLAALRRRRADGRPAPGLVLVGSHVPLSDQQLERLLAEPGCEGVELPVDPCLRGDLPELEEVRLRERLWAVLAAGRTGVLYTSRGERLAGAGAARRQLGQRLAAAMARLAAALAGELGYLISKGGITSQTLLADGLELAMLELQGQLLPGLSLVLPAQANGPAAGLPVLTFPGNLGEADTLALAWRWLETGQANA
ncbi:MAG: four-carbon acid sugar kinase family protein [Synechococcaceae cyanobacterium]